MFCITTLRADIVSVRFCHNVVGVDMPALQTRIASVDLQTRIASGDLQTRIASGDLQTRIAFKQIQDQKNYKKDVKYESKG